jgi:hypothetical protein
MVEPSAWDHRGFSMHGSTAACVTAGQPITRLEDDLIEFVCDDILATAPRRRIVGVTRFRPRPGRDRLQLDDLPSRDGGDVNDVRIAVDIRDRDGVLVVRSAAETRVYCLGYERDGGRETVLVNLYEVHEP